MTDEFSSEPNVETGIPKWLKKVQQYSWEPEILLSGLVLFGLFQLPAKVEQLGYFLVAECFGGNMSGIFVYLNLAIYTVIAGLMLHLFLRSVWVGFVGLSYAFPQGIQAQKLTYLPAYKRVIHSLPSIEAQILRLEKVCSAMFASCFYLIMLVIGVVIGVSLFVSFLAFINWVVHFITGTYYMNAVGKYLDTFIVVFLLLMLIDFISIGFYRRYNVSGKLFYPVYRLISFLTFSRFYRSVYYLFATNVRRGYVIFFFLTFTLFSLFGLPFLMRAPDMRVFSRIDFYSSSRKNYEFNYMYYRDRNETGRPSWLTLPSPVVSGPFVELQLKHQLRYEQSMYQLCLGEDATASQKKQMTREERLECVNAFYTLYVDGIKVPFPDWQYYFLSDEGRKGFISFLNIDSISPGKHHLDLIAQTTRKDTLAQVLFVVAK